MLEGQSTDRSELSRSSEWAEGTINKLHSTV